MKKIDEARKLIEVIDDLSHALMDEPADIDLEDAIVTLYKYDKASVREFFKNKLKEYKRKFDQL